MWLRRCAIALGLVLGAGVVNAGMFDDFKDKLREGGEAVEDVGDALEDAGDLLSGDGGRQSQGDSPKHAPEVTTSDPRPAAGDQLSSQPTIQPGVTFSSRNYHNHPKYFSQLAFPFGEYREVAWSGSDDFITLYVPHFEGLPRVGVMPRFEGQQGASDQHARTAVRERFTNDSLIYQNLALLGRNAEYVTPANVKADDSGKAPITRREPHFLYKVSGKDPEWVSSSAFVYDYYPRYHIESLAGALLTGDRYKQYFCAEGNDCLNAESERTVYGWGGGMHNNQFQAVRALDSFVDQIMPQMVEWGQTLDDKVAIVGTGSLGQYDFDRGGFQITLMNPGLNGEDAFLYAPRDKERDLFGITGRRHPDPYFLPMSPEAGKALKDRLKAKTQLYFVIEGEVYGMGSMDRSQGGRYTNALPGVRYVMETTGTQFSLYEDELLTKHIADLEVQYVQY